MQLGDDAYHVVDHVYYVVDYVLYLFDYVYYVIHYAGHCVLCSVHSHLSEPIMKISRKKTPHFSGKILGKMSFSKLKFPNFTA